MRHPARMVISALGAVLLLPFAALVQAPIAGATGTLPTNISYVVSETGLLTGPNCPSFAGLSPQPTGELSVAAALEAADLASNAGATIYVCPGTYTQNPPTATVTYSGGSGTTGNPPTDSTTYDLGATVTVQGDGTLGVAGETFEGWNSAANGSGTWYA